MVSARVIPALTRDAQLKRALRQHLAAIGFRKMEDGSLAAPGEGKDVVRALHANQRRAKLIESQKFLQDALPILASYFAAGESIAPSRVQLRLRKISAGTIESSLFKLASLLWSVP